MPNVDSELETLDANLRLGQAEYFLQRTYLRSMPRVLGLVLGNACNIDCPHCYQEKNGDNLLRPAEIGRQFRREFLSLYPYLSTLRIQGGEAMAYRGFRDLVEDVASVVSRPLLSISTNGTLIDDQWAETMVRLPFSSVTVSIDGGTRDTYAKMRRGSDLTLVLANVARIRKWKEKLNSARPALDSFFVILRSNFREIPQYLALMHENGFTDVALQTVEINSANSTREPLLEQNELIRDPAEIAELYSIMRETLPRARSCFRMIRVSGLQTLFESQGYNSSFLQEQENGLYPDSDKLAVAPQTQTLQAGEAGADLRKSAGAFELCPNPWTTLFVNESGGVHLCFLSEPVGNLYGAPLVEIWNSPGAIAKRLRMTQGKYLASGCSSHWCGWREGKAATPLDATAAAQLQREAKAAAVTSFPIIGQDSVPLGLTAVRRVMVDNTRKMAEMEQVVRTMEEEFIEMKQATKTMDEEFQRMRQSPLVRTAAHLARRWDRIRGKSNIGG